MNKKVLKFGGSSVASTDNLKAIAQYLRDRSRNEKLCVVVSARGKTTDSLIAEAYKFSTSPDTRELDRLLSTGEQQTISLLAMALTEIGVRARSLTARQAGITSVGLHTKSKIKSIGTSQIQKYFDDFDVLIVAGFQGINENDDVTTLGRGGSDTSAVAIASALGCDCEIYTDVDGIYGIDPRLYPNAKKLEEISYEEMMEMASLGAKVMEPRSIEIASKFGTIVYVARTLGTERGTYIMPSSGLMEKKVISGVSLNEKIVGVTINDIPFEGGIITGIFKTLTEFLVNVDMISQVVNHGKVDLMFTAEGSDRLLLDKAMKRIEEKYGLLDKQITEEISKVSVVGIGMRDSSGVASKVFEALHEINVPLYQITTSEISISLTVDKQSGFSVVNMLAQKFEL